ncbi:hypothetical protein MG293_014810 [Ovis ammon polii]|uniref:Uncharacterized protein n=1 Tax=Ovis ammon polii TaxID=230172 RepID=A0AAD4Y5F2_OVIAM|nr:hypothetical protein MG293_014810 [Ovis ammon polii]
MLEVERSDDLHVFDTECEGTAQVTGTQMDALYDEWHPPGLVVRMREMATDMSSSPFWFNGPSKHCLISASSGYKLAHQNGLFKISDERADLSRARAGSVKPHRHSQPNTFDSTPATFGPSREDRYERAQHHSIMEENNTSSSVLLSLFLTCKLLREQQTNPTVS